MPGAGTDHTRQWSAFGGPIVVLVEPQLGENIGTASRAMANFGLTRLRLVRPRDAWPNVHARRAASGADAILDGAVDPSAVHVGKELLVAVGRALFVARAQSPVRPVGRPHMHLRVNDHHPSSIPMLRRPRGCA